MSFLILSAVQSVLMFVDEFYCHYRRVFPRWEKVGHPLDTLSVIVCFLILIWAPESQNVYLLSSVFSTIFITKDEWVHHKHVKAFEQWLHAMLFVIHPVLLWQAYAIRYEHVVFLKGMLALLILFFTYQVVFWNFLKRKAYERN